MALSSPWSLLWLLPMAGLIVLMYVLKLRRRDMVVSSTFLWRQVIRDVQANAPFQKLRRNLLLFLQLLAVLLFVLALARPLWRGRGRGGRSVVLVVDTSASMLATDVGKNRLDEAKKAALQAVREMRPEDQMMVLSAAARPQSVSGFTEDRAQLTRAIESLTAHQTGTNMRDTLALAAALVAARESAQIEIFSDGGFAPITNVDLGKAHILYHPIGAAAHNVGITALDYRHGLAGDNAVQVFVTLRNFDSQPRTFTIELAQNKNILDAHEVTLPAGGENAELFDLPEPAADMILTARLDVTDDLVTDNQAAILITPRRTIKTLLVTNGNPFLEAGIQVDRDIQLDKVAPAAFTKPDGYDAVIFDAEAPATLPPGNYLFVNCTSDQSPAVPGAEQPNQTLLDAERSHPVLRYVDFGQTRWTTLHTGSPAAWGQELAASEAGAAIVAGEKGKMRALWLGFDLDAKHGSFPFTVGYPIFVSNALRWLSRTEDASGASIRTGSPVTLNVPPGTGRVTITKPDGTKRELNATTKGSVVWDETDQAGIYTAEAEGGWRQTFAANLNDEQESNIAPHQTVDFGINPPDAVGREVTVTRDFWYYIAGAVLLLLAIEWWAFHRRIYVQ